jgi:hypothetical protein
MSGERVERLAVLAADVAFYSELMGEDEEGTLVGLRDPPRAWQSQDRLQTAEFARRLLRGGELHRKAGFLK